MIQPISRVRRKTAMNPPMRGQNMALAYSPRRASGVQAHLLVGRREGPGDLHPPFLAKHEAHLAGGTQALRARGAKRAARLRLRDGTEKILVKEALLTTCLARRAPSRHCPLRPLYS